MTLRTIVVSTLLLVSPAIAMAAVPVDPHVSTLGVTAWSADAAPEALVAPEGRPGHGDPAADVWLESVMPGDDGDLGSLTFDPIAEGQASSGSNYEGHYPDALDRSDIPMGFALDPRDRGRNGGRDRKGPTGSDQPTNPVNPVPEPATVMLLAGGAAAAVWSSRKRRDVAPETIEG